MLTIHQTTNVLLIIAAVGCALWFPWVVGMLNSEFDGYVDPWLYGLMYLFVTFLCLLPLLFVGWLICLLLT